MGSISQKSITNGHNNNNNAMNNHNFLPTNLHHAQQTRSGMTNNYANNYRESNNFRKDGGLSILRQLSSENEFMYPVGYSGRKSFNSMDSKMSGGQGHSSTMGRQIGRAHV